MQRSQALRAAAERLYKRAKAKDLAGRPMLQALLVATVAAVAAKAPRPTLRERTVVFAGPGLAGSGSGGAWLQSTPPRPAAAVGLAKTTPLAYECR